MLCQKVNKYLLTSERFTYLKPFQISRIFMPNSHTGQRSGAGQHHWMTATHPRLAPGDLHHTPVSHHPRCQLSCVSGIVQT